MFRIIICNIICFWIFGCFLMSTAQCFPFTQIALMGKIMEMRTYMNESVEPCENFYEFACGNFAQFHTISDDDDEEKVSVSYFEIMEQAFDGKIKQLLSDLDYAADTIADRKVKIFYKSCVNLPDLYLEYSGKLLSLIEEFGQMPAVVGEKWQESSFDWQQVVNEIQKKYSINILWGTGINTDFYDNKIKVLFLTSGDWLLDNKVSYLDPEFQELRDSLVNATASNLINFLDIKSQQALKVAKEIVKFEVELARGLSEEGMLPTEMLTATNVDLLQTKYWPYLDIKNMLTTLYGALPAFPVYEQYAYLENLVAVMAKTPKHIVANYIFYKLAREFIFSCYDDEKQQQDYCVAKIKDYFPTNFENMVYRKYNSPQTEMDLREMWQYIKMAFKDVLESERLHWMSSETRLYALEKLENMHLELPALTPDFSDKDAERLAFGDSDFIGNMKSLKILMAADERDKLSRTLTPTDDIPIDTYSPQNAIMYNIITVPVALLQPFYISGQGVPPALAFAKLGSVLSHELLHGFDDDGRLYDKYGNLFEWWDLKSIEEFNELKQCFDQQYAAYIYAGQPLHRPPSQAENIADNGGIRLAYMAYLKWLDKHKAKLFRRFPYNSRQLFFIGYAQLWCDNVNPKYKLLNTLTDPHAPAEVRVMLTLQNLEEFSEVFHCPAASVMNRRDKCIIY
ncbi:neprilysin-1-like [Musca autumnalis]|uniref:neprilysin-1-like n=1 Tax=Musca autumnalis TaxID=221902 RepID=UPI003CE9AEB6